jgi:hypothetical protein
MARQEKRSPGSFTDPNDCSDRGEMIGRQGERRVLRSLRIINAETID